MNEMAKYNVVIGILLLTKMYPAKHPAKICKLSGDVSNSNKGCRGKGINKPKTMMIIHAAKIYFAACHLSFIASANRR